VLADAIDLFLDEALDGGRDLGQEAFEHALGDRVGKILGRRRAPLPLVCTSGRPGSVGCDSTVRAARASPRGRPRSDCGAARGR
jgi:hypothetical protein